MSFPIGSLFKIPRSPSALFDRSFIHLEHSATEHKNSKFLTTFDFHYPLIIKLYSTVVQTNMQVFSVLERLKI